MLRWMSHKYVIWALLALPLPWLLFYHRYISDYPGFFFYWTGVLAGLFGIASLAVTPIAKAFPRARWRLWVIRQRRYLGLAAFGYVAAHTAWWFYKAQTMRILTSFWDPVVTIAWINLVIYTALAVTSNSWSVKAMGPNWKRLQQWAYLGTFLGLFHWFWALKFPVSDTVVYGGLFVALMLLRLAYRRKAKPQS